MKVVDMHCDTLYEMEKNHLSLSENNLNIDIKKMEEGDYLLQNFAIFTELKERFSLSLLMMKLWTIHIMVS